MVGIRMYVANILIATAASYQHNLYMDNEVYCISTHPWLQSLSRTPLIAKILYPVIHA